MRRRHFLLLGASAALAACGGDDGGPPEETVSEEEAESDVAIVNNLLDLEYTEVAAYEAAARVLRGETRAAARRAADQERAHAAGVGGGIRRLGGRPNPAPPAGEYAAAFPPLGDPTQALEFLL